MNKIVRESYPASRLPADLRVGLDGVGHVRIVIEALEDSPRATEVKILPIEADRSFSGAEILESIRAYKAKHGSTTTQEEAVRRIRELRDEWDDE